MVPALFPMQVLYETRAFPDLTWYMVQWRRVPSTSSFAVKFPTSAGKVPFLVRILASASGRMVKTRIGTLNEKHIR